MAYESGIFFRMTKSVEFGWLVVFFKLSTLKSPVGVNLERKVLPCLKWYSY